MFVKPRRKCGLEGIGYWFGEEKGRENTSTRATVILTLEPLKKSCIYIYINCWWSWA